MRTEAKMGARMSLREAAAFRILNLLRSEDVPWVAVRALEQGLDSPSLRQLAGYDKPTRADVDPLFLRALSELSIASPDRNSARLIVARFHARRILDGTVTPYQGACQIWFGPAHDALLEPEPEAVSSWLKLRHFIGFASECDDDPDSRDAYELEIVEAAKQLDADPEAA